MTRVATGSLLAPAKSRIVADFTDGSIPAAAVVFDAGFPAANGRTYSYDSNGVRISHSGGSTGQYASFKWEPHAASPGATIDISDSDWFGIEVEHPIEGAQVYSTLSVFMTQQTGSTYTNYKNRTLTSGAAKIPLRQIIWTRHSVDNYTLTGGGPASLATLGKIEVRLAVHATFNGKTIDSTVRVKRFWVGQNSTKVLLSFDDGRSGQIMSGLPILSAAGFKATLYTSAVHVDRGAGYMTTADMATLYAAGWDFGVQQYNDTADVPFNFAGSTGLTSDGLGTATFQNGSSLPTGQVPGNVVTISGAASSEYNGQKTILSCPSTSSFTYAISGTPVTPDPSFPVCARPGWDAAKIRESFDSVVRFYQARGQTRGLEHVAYSSGCTSPELEALMVQWGYKSGRTTRINTAPNVGFDPRGLQAVDWMRLPSIPMDQQTASTILAYVDTCITYGVSCMLYGHDINATPAVFTITESEFIAIVEGLRIRKLQGKLDVVTITQFWEQLAGGRAQI